MLKRHGLQIRASEGEEVIWFRSSCCNGVEMVIWHGLQIRAVQNNLTLLQTPSRLPLLHSKHTYPWSSTRFYFTRKQALFKNTPTLQQSL
jgi:hypothetical protein